jgi:endonuclease G
MRVDLSKTAGGDSMRQLAPPDASGFGNSLQGMETHPEGVEYQEIEIVSGIEATGKESKKNRVLVTKPETLADREGYRPAFLGDWTIPLPVPQGELKRDVRDLRRGGKGWELKYEHFSTCQSISRRMPMFVGVNIDGTARKKITCTNMVWRFDGRLDIADQIGTFYSHETNMLDHGHMMRREGPNWGEMNVAQRANTDTFHFTNACPQMAAVNQRLWLGLENYVLLNTRKHTTRVSAFTGPVFTDEDLPYRGTLVPRSFWKVVAVVDEGGRPSATAYEVSQKAELSALEFLFGECRIFQTSIKDIEEKTGLSFGDLSSYDGFSAIEATTGKRQRSPLENFEMVRI